MKKIGLLLVALSLLGGCANTSKNLINMEGFRHYQSDKQIVPKRNIMVESFDNRTRYGRGKFLNFGTEVISTEMSKTQRFKIVERDPKKLAAIKKELNFMANSAERESKLSKNLRLDEAEFAIFGTLTSFGVQEIQKNTLVSTSLTQVVRATVDIKVMELATGQTWSETGEFESEDGSGTVLSLGSGKSYNENFEERAVRGAIVDAMNKVINRIDNTPWNAMGKVVGNKVYIKGVGKESNLKIGTKLDIYTKGQKIYVDDEFLGFAEENVGTAIVENYISGGKEGSIGNYSGKSCNNMEVIVRISKQQ
ncbi:CsgG/HfaB family protein [Cetobacterium sp. SF1]|uniref:CsgG/HfaB family protein n=1 Tax=Cetobacterium sp. SF1 TaxID=3417654 RepID=UPI003CF293F0